MRMDKPKKKKEEEEESRSRALQATNRFPPSKPDDSHAYMRLHKRAQSPLFFPHGVFFFSSAFSLNSENRARDPALCHTLIPLPAKREFPPCPSTQAVEKLHRQGPPFRTAQEATSDATRSQVAAFPAPGDCSCSHFRSRSRPLYLDVLHQYTCLQSPTSPEHLFPAKEQLTASPHPFWFFPPHP